MNCFFNPDHLNCFCDFLVTLNAWSVQNSCEQMNCSCLFLPFLNAWSVQNSKEFSWTLEQFASVQSTWSVLERMVWTVEVIFMQLVNTDYVVHTILWRLYILLKTYFFPFLGGWALCCFKSVHKLPKLEHLKSSTLNTWSLQLWTLQLFRAQILPWLKRQAVNIKSQTCVS
jgi:hypothetical protein